MDALIVALRSGFVALSRGEVSLPGRTAARSSEGFLATMAAFQPGPDGGLAVKLVSVFAGNRERGLPSHQALIALFEPDTGSALAVMDGEEITALRTAAAAALSTQLLARAESCRLAILGAGVQGGAHLRALPKVRPFTDIVISSRDQAHAAALARHDERARVASSAEEAVSGADVVCCCTDSAEPVLRAEWLRPGAHVTSVGFAESGGELDPQLVRSASWFVESRAACEPWPVGAHELADVEPASVTELGEVLEGSRSGRQDASEVTVYKSVGFAIEDLVAAQLVYERARLEGRGTRLEL